MHTLPLIEGGALDYLLRPDMHTFNPYGLKEAQQKSVILCGSFLGLTMRGVDTQVDGHRGDALVGPGNAVSLCLDLLPDLVKVCELFALTVEELSIFWEKREQQTVSNS